MYNAAEVAQCIPSTASYASDILYTAGGIINILAFILYDFFWLRTLIIIASILKVIAGFMFVKDSIIIINAAILLINAYWIIKLFILERLIMIPSHIRSLYNDTFNEMSRAEFLSLYKKASVVKYYDEFVLKSGENANRLLLIISGEVTISKNSRLLAKLSHGDFVGEMDVLTKSKAVAGAKAIGEVSFLSWKVNDILILESKEPATYIKLQNILSRNLIKKLKKMDAALLDEDPKLSLFIHA